MTSTFYRMQTDHRREFVPLENLFAGPVPSACWIIGGGPSLSRLPIDEIRASPIPKMGINLSGTGLLRPTFWTSYDPSARFHRSVYLDPGIMKFVHRQRAMDLVPETTFKVCECPNLYCFDRDRRRGFADFLSPEHRAIVDWADSLVQAIDILYRLGFRVLYLAGCEMRVRPSREQIALAADHGVRFDPRERLARFLRDCEQAGLSAQALDASEPGLHYHFAEHKPIRAAADTDSHYFRVAQYLRLSRRALATAGVRLVSVTPRSRLNDYFPYRPASRVLAEIRRSVGSPENEPVTGLYRRIPRREPALSGPMQDFRPHHWPREKPPDRQPTRPIEAEGELIVEAEGYERVQRPAWPGNGR